MAVSRAATDVSFDCQQTRAVRPTERKRPRPRTKRKFMIISQVMQTWRFGGHRAVNVRGYFREGYGGRNGQSNECVIMECELAGRKVAGGIRPSKQCRITRQRPGGVIRHKRAVIRST